MISKIVKNKTDITNIWFKIWKLRLKKNKRHFRGLPRVDVKKDMSTKFPTRHLLHLFS